ncbi:MAG TPA: OsmC family protein [bacterium]|nr:OsmC family protein [bacterium]HMW36217.1 OsmC family protein [bacterium]HMY36379.1 OsmC family protein [bacterium]HMZ05453.1 OsmC family protein [bacterium]HNB09585.1 OsmC family protein [bacterium]
MPLIKRSAQAHWAGTGKEGKGDLSTQSTVLNKTQYSFGTRFENGVGTNPEELIGAAHAGCFTMKLSFVLNAMGLTAEALDTKATVSFEDGVVTQVHLELTGKVPGCTAEKFQEAANDAKANCPISKLLNTTITLDAKLV